jgi:hypothetical protein
VSQTKAQLLDGSVVSVAFSAGSVGAPSLYFTGDTNTGIYSPGADTLAFVEGGVEAMRIDSSGRLLVGTSTSAPDGSAQIQLVNSAPVLQVHRNANDASQATLVLSKARGSSNQIVQSGDTIGNVNFQAADGSNAYLLNAALISAQVDGTPGASDMPGRLVFSTTADGAATPTERMRITNGGKIWINTTSDLGGLGGFLALDTAGTRGIVQQVTANTRLQEYLVGGSTVGFISTDGTGTTFSTTSDYRLKENVVPLTAAIDRLNQLQVHRFNFLADPAKTVDGFIAHEAQAVVPECVTGEKDAVDADGNPVYQGIDQSKLVPLLTAALQEAIAKIETLEARLTAAGIA